MEAANVAIKKESFFSLLRIFQELSKPARNIKHIKPISPRKEIVGSLSPIIYLLISGKPKIRPERIKATTLGTFNLLASEVITKQDASKIGIAKIRFIFLFF